MCIAITRHTRHKEWWACTAKRAKVLEAIGAKGLRFSSFGQNSLGPGASWLAGGLGGRVEGGWRNVVFTSFSGDHEPILNYK